MSKFGGFRSDGYQGAKDFVGLVTKKRTLHRSLAVLFPFALNFFPEIQDIQSLDCESFGQFGKSLLFFYSWWEMRKA